MLGEFSGASTRLRQRQLSYITALRTEQSASATNEPDDKHQHQRADGSFDDRRNNTQAEMDAELRRQATDEGAYDSNDPKPAPCTIELCGKLGDGVKKAA